MNIETKFNIGESCFIVVPHKKNKINIIEDQITKMNIIVNENYSRFDRFDIWCETKGYYHMQESYFHKSIDEAIEFQKNYWRVIMQDEKDMTVAYNCRNCRIAVIREITHDRKTYKYCEECENLLEKENDCGGR